MWCLLRAIYFGGRPATTAEAYTLTYVYAFGRCKVPWPAVGVFARLGIVVAYRSGVGFMCILFEYRVRPLILYVFMPIARVVLRICTRPGFMCVYAHRACGASHLHTARFYGYMI